MMQELSDIELLKEYAEHGSDRAFRTLVSRHINMVYSVALRHVRNPSQAEEISQAVFIVLAKKARSLGDRTVLSGWLFNTARLTAANYVRKEIRRVRNEQEAYMQSTLTEEEDAAWERIAPCLDAAMAELGEKDRNAIVLRYVEGKNLREVGVALGASEDAAKMRVNRALEKLRIIFKKRGIVLSGAGLSGVIAAHSVQAAPAGLAGAVVMATTQGVAVTASTMAIAKGTLNLMAWTKLKIAGGVVAVGLLAFQGFEMITQKQELAAVRQELRERKNEVAMLKAESERMRQDRLGMEKDLQAANTEKARAIGKQKAAVVAAKNASVAAAGKEMSSLEVAKLLDDPAMNELFRSQIKGVLKAQLGNFIQKSKLSEEEADKFYATIIENQITNRATAAALIRGQLDVNQALAARDQAEARLENDLRSVLGDANYTQYQEFKKDAFAKDLLGMLKREASQHPLSKEQESQFLKVARAMPEMPKIDNIDLFRSKESMDQIYQGLEGSAHQNHTQAEKFLSAEQLASLDKVQTGFIENIKSQMALGEKILKQAGQ